MGGFTLAAWLAAAGPAQAPSVSGQELLSGLVTTVDGTPAMDAEVTFHYAATLGIAWLRSAAEEVVVVRGQTDRDGRFVLRVPPGVLGTCVARRDHQLGLVARCDPRRVVRVQLAKLGQRRFNFTGAVTERLDVTYEGPSPLADAQLAGVAGVFLVPRLPGFGSTLLLPPDLSVRGHAHLPASGVDRERFRLSAAATTPMPFGWRRSAAGLRWHSGTHVPLTQASYGQRADGQPFAYQDGGLVEPAVGARTRLPAAAMTRAVLVAECHDLGAPGFAAAIELPREGDEFVLPAWCRGDVATMVVVETAAGPTLLGADHRLVPTAPLSLRLTGAESALVRLRPARCQPAAGSVFAGLELAVACEGVASLPVLLPAGRYQWVAMASDGRCAEGQFDFATHTPLHIELPDGASLAGLVLDADGEPAGGVMVSLLAGRSDVPASFGWVEHQTHTDRSGEFVLRGLVAGRDYELLAGGAAFGEVLANGVRPEASPVLLQLRVPASPR